MAGIRRAPTIVPMTEQLRGYVDVWWEAVNDFATLLEELPAEAWSTPTDLPGWDVHAVAAHVAHLECLTAGGRHEEVEIGDAPHARDGMGQFTEQGVVARRDATPDELINEIRSSATQRHTALLEDMPDDPDAQAPGIFGAIGWTQGLLLRNRPLDVFMHQQDVRRAVGLPGGLDSAAATHTADYLLESLGFVVAKRAGLPAGSVVELSVDGHAPVAVAVGDDGRARPVEDTEPTTRIHTDRESFLMLAGGRRQPADGRVEISGDTEAGQRVVDRLGVTP